MQRKNRIKCTKYDVVFVLPTPLIYPVGGYDVVYRLASGLNKNGIKTAIYFIINAEKFVPNYFSNPKPKSLKGRLSTLLINIPIPNFLFEYIYHHYKLIANSIFKVDYDYDILKNVSLYLIQNKIPKLNTKIIIATAWQTAYLVNEYKASGSNLRPYYLVQNSEDDPSFSGLNSPNAKITYTFELKKIVINKKMLQRFEEDDPLFFHVGFDLDFYKVMHPSENRDYDVMFPLRSNESKGAKYAISTMERLLKERATIKIISFGDMNEEEIPEYIKDKIEYYYQPTKMELRSIYNSSKIFVLPSLVEGMSLPTLEAMACGCAVVVTDNGGTNEYIQDGINGLVCPIKDPNCLYEKIIFLLDNVEKKNEMIKNGMKTCKEYSYENMVMEFTKIIEGELKNSG